MLSSSVEYEDEEIISFSDRETVFMSRLGQYVGIGVMTTISHPLLYIKTLRHIGYQPTALLSKDLLSTKDVSFFTYGKSVISDVGIPCLYAGYGPRLFGNLLFNYIELNTNYWLDRLVNGNSDTSLDSQTFDDGSIYEWESPYIINYLFSAIKRYCTHMFATIICHPLHVISTEMILSTLKGGISSSFSAIRHIWENNGFSGFFNGLVDQLALSSRCMLMTLVLYYIFISIPQFKLDSRKKEGIFIFLSMVSAIHFRGLDYQCTISRIDGRRLSSLIAKNNLIYRPNVCKIE